MVLAINEATPLRKNRRRVTASIKNPFTMSKKRANPACHPPEGEWKKRSLHL
jgi:hypothetical protein